MLLLLNVLPQEYRSKIEQMYKEYYKYLLYIAYSILKDKEIAEDILQSAFVRVIKHVSKIEGLSCNQTKGYLVIIVKNLALDYLRKEKRQKKVSYDEIEFAIQDVSSSTEDIAMINFEFETIKAKLEEMDEKYALPLIMKYSLNYPNKEIAEILGLTIENVNVRCFRGKQKLIKALRKDLS